MSKNNKPETEKRNIDLGVKVSQTEEKKILEKAIKLNLSKSEYVRLVLLNAKIELSL